MFNLLKFASLQLLKSHNITDERSCRVFLRELILLIKPLAVRTKTTFDDTLLEHIEFVVNNDVLFEYVYRLMVEHFQTSDILFESADESKIAELVESAISSRKKSPEAINPALVISLITQIISIINTIKSK